MSISVDDFHLLVEVPSYYPERIQSVASGDVEPEMVGPAVAYKGRGGPVEPATLVKVKGSG